MTVDETEIARQEEAARQLLRRLIQASGFSQQELEDEMGVAHGYLSRLLSGSKRLMYRHILLVLRLIGVPPSEFFRTLSPRRQPTPVKQVSGEDVRRLLGRHGVRPRTPAAHEPVERIDLEEFKRDLLAAVERVLADRLGGLGPGGPQPGGTPPPESKS